MPKLSIRTKEAINLETAGTAVLGLQKDRRGQLAADGCFANALLTVEVKILDGRNAVTVRMLVRSVQRSPWPATMYNAAPSGPIALPLEIAT